MKKENLKNLWIQGLLMAVVIAAALPIPDIAFAQLSATADTSRNSVFAPMLELISFASYVIGGVLVIGGVMKIKHHTENPTQTPLSHGFVRVGAGSALLALPFLMGLANQTASNTLQGHSTLTQFQF